MRGSKPLPSDGRAIEHLPIRLVIALVVGVASLSMMMSAISPETGHEFGDEVDARVHPEVIDADEPATVTITVVDEDGQPVPDARVYLEEGTARFQGDSIETKTTDGNGNVTFTFTPQIHGPNQMAGILVIDIDPPSRYEDNADNSDVTVVRNP